MSRAFLLVLDSFGIGGAPDAARFGDEGSDTFGHILAACAAGTGDRAGLRRGPLDLPNLMALGLGHAWTECTGGNSTPIALPGDTAGQWGYAVETSRGKDTPSGHWELAGVPVTFDWGYFPDETPAFPPKLIEDFIACTGLPGVLGDRHASGTEIIDDLGEEHMRSGKPIVYTSADSVFQIAAHEESFGLERLYAICETGRELVDPLNIGRVIARPFVGSGPGDFERTANRRDYSVPPPEPTLLDRLTGDGRQVISIGKIGDIFAHQGTGDIRKAAGNAALFDETLRAVGTLADGGLAIANYVDFDTLFGHRRDVAGYAAALETFDRRLPAFLRRLKPGDLAILTADHGCDPTWTGTDHTRECVPVLASGPDVTPRRIGRRASFSDVGQTIAQHLAMAPLNCGAGWLSAND
ncbi:MAG: phosphopentomutase [Hyphomicrobiales bacterium]